MPGQLYRGGLGSDRSLLQHTADLQWLLVQAQGSEEVLGSQARGKDCISRNMGKPLGSLLLKTSREKSARTPRPTSAHHKMATALCMLPGAGEGGQRAERAVFSGDSYIPNPDGLSIPSMSSLQAESPSDVGLGMSLHAALSPGPLL